MKNFPNKIIKTLKGLPQNNFENVYIETLGSCTNKCYMCPNRCGNQEFRGRMSDETFKLIIKELKNINYSEKIHLYAQNEPFLDKSIINKIYYTHNELPKSKIILISNFTVLNDELIDEILKAPIHNLSCSIYALDEENYKSITGRNNFKNSFINQVKFLKKYGQKTPFSFANYIINNEYITKDINFIKHYLCNIAPVAFIQESKLISFFNSKNNKLKQSNKYFSDCIYSSLLFKENGDFSICNCDKDGLMKIGNIYSLEGNLIQAHRSKEACKIRRQMFSFNLKNKKNYCQYCEIRRPQTFFDFICAKSNNINDKYKHKLMTKRNTKEEIQQKLIKFNKLFKDNEEANWFETLNNLRKDFNSNIK